MSSASTNPPAPDQAPKFGTFLGVYTPSVLTILGLIMYLRFGWVVGNLGLRRHHPDRPAGQLASPSSPA